MRTDLVLSPFGAESDEMLAAARLADVGGFDGVWTFDHFSGIVAQAGWSRDPFVVLGAVAASTDRVRIGVLVANMANRAPAQLASAVNSLQSLAPGRVDAGIGAGAGPGSPFGAEQEAVGRRLLPPESRREGLAAYINALRALWGDDHHHEALARVIDRTHPRPPVIVGANGSHTIQLAALHGDGVNIRAGKHLEERVAQAREVSRGDGFEISVFDRLDLDHPVGGDIGELERLGVDRRTLVIDAPYDLDELRAISRRLSTLSDR